MADFAQITGAEPSVNVRVF